MNAPSPAAIVEAIRNGATTTTEIAAAIGCLEDDDFYWLLVAMNAEGYFVKTPTGPGTYRLNIKDER